MTPAASVSRQRAVQALTLSSRSCPPTEARVCFLSSCHRSIEWRRGASERLFIHQRLEASLSRPTHSPCLSASASQKLSFNDEKGFRMEARLFCIFSIDCEAMMAAARAGGTDPGCEAVAECLLSAPTGQTVDWRRLMMTPSSSKQMKV